MIYFLYGAPASGKTTLGKRLAEALKCEFMDLDEAIANRASRSIAEIFAKGGEESFRLLEGEELFCAVSELNAAKKDAVIALGGGTLLDQENRKICEKMGVVLCLETPPEEELARRVGADGGKRPLGNKAKERAAHYASFTHRIAAWFDLPNSLVLVGENYAPFFVGKHPGIIDEKVAKLYAIPAIHTLPSGERHKTISTIASLWSAFAKSGLTRREMVVAIGGGVTGDLTGFAAATWMRGIDWINIPTTLLSMIDASVGGKTGVDLPEGKNLAGAFHAPRLVAIDADFLKTLPPEILRQGKAEMIKHAAIGGERRVENGKCKMAEREILLATEIAANLAVKVAIVKEDPFERAGKRALLNCGHTIGHALEAASRYRLSHGECVAIGCVEEARLAVQLALADSAWPEELAARFAAEGLPTAMPDGMSIETLLPFMKQDKKREDANIVFALPCGWGHVEIRTLSSISPPKVV